MLSVILIGLAAVALTVLVHAAGTAWWLRRLRQVSRLSGGPRKKVSGFLVLIRTALVLIALHAIEVLIWALIYWIVRPDGLDSFEEAMYFSFSTFTTLGYGDLVIGPPWRLLTGIESLNGVLLVGWSTALSFAVIQKVWNALEEGKPEPAPGADVPGGDHE
ncbi:MAG: potassium channel family protein [Holophagales bacterium]|nr:potassium channel family protein [Holophagales bacterium]